MAKTFKKKGTKIEVTETRVYEEDIEALQNEKQGIANARIYQNAREQEIDAMLNS